MGSFIVRRILWLIPVLIVVSLITFILMHLVPGGPWSTDKAVARGVQAAIDRQYHLNDPVWLQYLRWIFDFIRGDFGPSFRYADRSINQIIADGLPATVQLGLMAFTLSVRSASRSASRGPRPQPLARLPLDLHLDDRHRDAELRARDPAGRPLRRQPQGPARPGLGAPDTWVLPTVALAGFQIAQIARYTRASMLEVTRKDYVRTAQSKGLEERAIVVRHMIRNALIPVVTILGPTLAFLVTGSFIIETFFGIPGIGRYYVTSIIQHDYGLIMAMTILYAFAVAFLNLVVDVLYAYIDPRIRYS